jgi:hypothetical protein
MAPRPPAQQAKLNEEPPPFASRRRTRFSPAKKLDFSPLRKDNPLQMAQPRSPVLDLLQRFDRNREASRSPHHNETQLRREFLDPLFKALGWGLDPEQGYADVVESLECPYSMWYVLEALLRPPGGPIRRVRAN